MSSARTGTYNLLKVEGCTDEKLQFVQTFACGITTGNVRAVRKNTSLQIHIVRQRNTKERATRMWRQPRNRSSRILISTRQT
jgi:hypothetical protein